MRKLLLTVLLAASFAGVYAQKLDEVKEKISKKKWDEAREKLDKAMADPKNASGSDAWFYKAQIYSNLSKAKPEDAALAASALEAMKRYAKLEEGKAENTRMLMSTLEGNATFYDIYQDYFRTGVKRFQGQDYANAVTSFQGALDAFDVLSKYNLTTVKFDTTVTIYAGFSAQNAKMFDEAARYYDRIVDAKIFDTSYMDAYRFLINYNLDTKKDTAAAQRYLAINQKAFPSQQDLWIDYDMAMMPHDRVQKLARYKQLTVTYPQNFVVAMNYGVELYNGTFFDDKKPADYAGQQELTRVALQNALALDPSNAHGNFIMSQFFVNQIYDIEDSVRAVKGTTPADVAKRKDMNARLDAKYENMYAYSQKAYDLYAKETNIKAQDKANYRKAINQLIDYHTRKKQTDKVTFYGDKLKGMK